MSSKTSKRVSRVVAFISCEFFLTKLKWANGGSVIFIRTTIISILLFVLYIIFMQCLDPGRLWKFSMRELQLQIISSIEIFAAVFAAIYVALYSRFSSQWNYLANLFNQIKAVEVSGSSNRNALSYWKAGFIEDAIELHLARKRMFAVIISAWGKDKEVEKAFKESIPNGKKIFRKIMDDVKEIAEA